MQNLSTTEAAREFGVSRETVIRALRSAGLDVAKGMEFSVAQIHRALSGDVKTATARDRLASAMLKEEELRRLAGETILVEEAKAAITDILSAVRQRLISIPARMGPRTNPNDPLFATRALEIERDEALKEISQAVVDMTVKKATKDEQPATED